MCLTKNGHFSDPFIIQGKAMRYKQKSLGGTWQKASYPSLLFFAMSRTCTWWLGLQQPSCDLRNGSEWSEVIQSCPTLCDPMDYSYQAPPSVGFSRQECWSGLPFPSPGDFPHSGIEPRSPALQADALPSEPPGKPPRMETTHQWTEKYKDSGNLVLHRITMACFALILTEFIWKQEKNKMAIYLGHHDYISLTSSRMYFWQTEVCSNTALK